MSIAEVLLVVGGVILAILVAGLVLTLLLGVPWQAYRRGQGFLSWFVLQIIAVNPIYPMILVALLPDRAKARLRERFARELDAQLAEAGVSVAAPPVAQADPARSIGDLPTAGASIGDLPTGGASVGGLPTTMPGRSIGDAETRAPGSS